jgi:hypothetical protein
MRCVAGCVGAVTAMVIAVTVSRADVAPPPPTVCPPDTFPTTNHGGAGCVPATCPIGSAGTICEEGPCCAVVSCETSGQPQCNGGTCQDVRLCVQPGFVVGFAAHHEAVKRALARCDLDGSSCPEGSTCETIRACVGESFPVQDSFVVLPSDDPAQVRAPVSVLIAASLAVIALAVVFGLVIARRRRRRAELRHDD